MTAPASTPLIALDADPWQSAGCLRDILIGQAAHGIGRDNRDERVRFALNVQCRGFGLGDRTVAGYDDRFAIIDRAIIERVGGRCGGLFCRESRGRGERSRKREYGSGMQTENSNHFVRPLYSCRASTGDV